MIDFLFVRIPETNFQFHLVLGIFIDFLHLYRPAKY